MCWEPAFLGASFATDRSEQRSNRQQPPGGGPAWAEHNAVVLWKVLEVLQTSSVTVQTCNWQYEWL